MNPTSLTLFTPSGVLANAAPLRLAARRLAALGFAVHIDEAALLKHQRFGGDDTARLATLHRIATEAPSVAMATRGGYGLTRLLDRIDWAALARSVERGTRWVGQSDLTALQLGLLAHAQGITWAGPMACYDFGREEVRPQGRRVAATVPPRGSKETWGGPAFPSGHGEKRGEAVDEITQACFVEAMTGVLEAVGFRTEPGFDGLLARGTLWGGNLCMVSSLLGTPHWPKVRGGVLFLEDVNEHPYRIERGLLQLHQAGVLDAQKAVLLGAFSDYRKSPLDRGYTLKSAVAHLRSVTRTPILTGLPFGHVPTKVCLPVGAKVTLAVQGRDVLVGW
jgi:muramoyltetrapeptide carboxypeptidase